MDSYKTTFFLLAVTEYLFVPNHENIYWQLFQFMFRFDIIVRSYFQSNKWRGVKDFILRFFYGTHLPTVVIFHLRSSVFGLNRHVNSTFILSNLHVQGQANKI